MDLPGGSAPEEIWLRLITGMPPGPMPSFANLSAQQRWDLVNYTLSLAGTPAWEPGGRLDGLGQQTDPAGRGRYLVSSMMCGLCHTPINRTGIYRGDDFYLAGGMRVGVYALPGLRLIPPEQLVAAASPEPPKLDRAEFATPEQAALAERGRYLFTVTSCALCHLPNGAGGAKISWKPMGTLWTRNITPDPETGIGTWTDAQIARAIRSGVAADGRMLHWQGMIWDHLSNLDEEDVRALVAYLRTLPAVRRQIPPARPPAPDDCGIYTFWLGPSLEAGCR